MAGWSCPNRHDMFWDGCLHADCFKTTSGGSSTDIDDIYVNTVGDTMTGRLNINQTISDVALNATQTNSSASTVWVSGNQKDMGTLKVTHEKPTGTDSDSAAISVLVSGASTSARGLFMDNDGTGDMLNLRKNGEIQFRVEDDGSTTISKANLTMYGANSKVKFVGPSNGIDQNIQGGAFGIRVRSNNAVLPRYAMYFESPSGTNDVTTVWGPDNGAVLAELNYNKTTGWSLAGNTKVTGDLTVTGLSPAGFVKNTSTGLLSGGHSIDISGDTNLAVTSPITLTDDTIGFDFTTDNTWTGAQTYTSPVSYANTLKVSEKIEHLGDSNTYMQFEAQTDNISFTCGGVEFVDMQESIQDLILINPGINNVDLAMHGDNQSNLLYVDASRDTVSIGSNSSLGLFGIIGFSDESLLVIRGNSTQTKDTFVVENSSGTDQFTVNNSGDIMANGTTDLGGVEYTWPGSDGSNGQQLTTNGSGTLSWTDQDGGGGGGHATAYLSVTIDSVSGALTSPYNVFDSGDYTTSYSTANNVTASNFSYYDTSGAFQYDGSTTSAAIKLDANLYVRPVETSTVRVRVQRNGTDIHDYDYDLSDSESSGCHDRKVIIPVSLIINMEQNDNIKVIANHTNIPGGCIGSQMHVREGTTINFQQIA